MPVDLGIDEDDRTLTLEGYVRALEDGGYDLTRHEDLVASAPLLKRLANNKTFLLERMFDELRGQLRFQAGNMYAPEVFLLHATRDYFVRANVWKTMTVAEQSIPGFQYDVCHDHNFDILTVGYLGLGYRCRSYTYDREGYEGRLGEAVELEPEGLFSLTNGKVALYRAKEDVHIQLPPDRLSVSLNLIPRSPVQNELQFQFDETSGAICRYLNFTGLEAVVRVADLLGDEGNLEALSRIGDHHPSARVRALALAASIHIDPGRSEEVLSGLRASRSDDVRYLVDLELASYGSTMRQAPPVGGAAGATGPVAPAR